MATETFTTKKGPSENGKEPVYRTRQDWPLDFEAAYRRVRGPYTAVNTWVLLDEEPLELFNGWLVWQPMTDADERRIAGVIQEILSLAARWAHFGQAYPDQLECVMGNGDVFKPDVCLVSHKRFDSRVEPVAAGLDHKILRGSPEFVVEIRSPSNRRTQERRKRKIYFENGTEVIWDVDPIKHKIWVYEVENPETSREFNTSDEITCERFLPGWKRKVGDFFEKDLTTEQIVGQPVEEWRKEGFEQGERATLIKLILRQAGRRFGESALPSDLEATLNRLSPEQLTELADAINVSSTLADWLTNFSD
jgi:Uma2 family endonuclease